MNGTLPYSFPVEAAALPPRGHDYRLVADAAERAAIARALGLEALDELRAELTVTPATRGTYTVAGTFTAHVVQACVVTLAPVPADVRDTITRRFAAAAAPRAEGHHEEEGWVDPDAEIIDAFADGILDLGDIVVEQLSLSLEPYPRAPGATFAGLTSGEEAKEPSGPFAALAELKSAKAAPRRRDRSRDGKSRPSKRKT